MSRLKNIKQIKLNKKLIGKVFKVVGVGLIISGFAVVSIYNSSQIKQLKTHNSKMKKQMSLEKQVKKALQDNNSKLNKENLDYKEEIQRIESELKERDRTIQTKDDEVQVLKKKLDSLIKNKSSQQTVSNRGGQINSITHKGNWITMNASAYTNSPSENGGCSTTAMGEPLVFGVVAIDPRFLPLGTKINIEGYGDMVFKCSDTGGAIKGNRIDILLNSKSEAMQFGRKQVKVRVIK